MRAYHWWLIGLGIITLFGTLLTSLLTAFILWAKTKGMVDLKVKTHGERLGGVERKLERVITQDSCDHCKNESQKLGEVLINHNADEHKQVLTSISALTKEQTELSKCVAALSENIKTLFRKVENAGG